MKRKIYSKLLDWKKNDADNTAQMMNAAVDKVTELFNIYSAGNAPYEYRETGDDKYKQFDDLARVKD